MKGYIFKLAPVLKMRKLQEDLAKQELGRLYVERQNILDLIESENQDIDQAYHEQSELLKKGMTGREVVFFPQVVEAKNQRIKILQGQVSALDRKIEAQKHTLTLKRADVKVMTSMQEKDFAQWKKSYQKKTEENLEELVQSWRQIEGLGND